jgi:flagellar capping protein FliD
MSDYLAIVDGSFEIHDGTGLLGTINYTSGESLDALAADIDALAGVNAQVTVSGGNFRIEIKSDTNDALTFQNDTGGAVAALGISDKGDAVYSANINGAANGADDGSVTVDGLTLTATDQTSASGLKLFYNGTTDLAGATLNYTVGIGAKINFLVDSFLGTDGLVESEITNLNGQNELANQRIDEMTTRLDLERQALLAKFIRMETTLATMSNILDSLKQTVDAAFNSNNN